jgi:phosphoserine phosphatase RsbU/P
MARGFAAYNPPMANPPSPGAPHASAAPTRSPRPYLRLQSVNVYVRDQERSLAFYRDQLGFRVVVDVRLQSGERWVAVAPADGTAMLSLVSPQPDSPEHKLIGRSTQVVFVTDDVAATFQEWIHRGVRFPTAPRLRRIKYDHRSQDSPGRSAILGQAEPIWGGALARFRDIDGNSFTLVSFDEITRALEAQRRVAAERLEAERRAAQEIEIATRVQAGLFPQTLPSLRTLDYAGACIQARQVGGDYYDFLHLGAERLGLVIGDISGKGIAAALLMANLQAVLRSLCAIAADQPERLLRSVNQLFCENTADGAYATLFFAEYDDASRRLRYANCGHLSALLFRRDGALDRLDSTSLPVGLFKKWDCALGERQLLPGDTLALYTDGVTESFDPSGDEFGEKRLVEALRRNRHLASQPLVASLVEELRRFSPAEQHDDITLIVAHSR